MRGCSEQGLREEDEKIIHTALKPLCSVIAELERMARKVQVTMSYSMIWDM
jgi:hypothetical protein